jgi:hypothetical protein
MTETDYAQFQSNHFDQLAKEFDHVCEQRLRRINERLSNEQPPYPLHHVVTLARAVHVLAMRTLNDDHPAKHLLSKSYTSNGRHGLHRYWITVFRLNDAVNQDAQTNALCLRDRLTGLPIQEWRTPSKVECSKWERLAILPNAGRETADRQALEIMATRNWPLLAVHFDSDVVVSLAEFDAWAVSTGIAEAGEVSALLHGAEEQMAMRARITEAAIAAEERGEKFDLGQFEAEQQPAPEKTATPAPVVAVGASGDVGPDKAGLVDKGWVMKKAALMDKHADKWKTINGDFHSASENGLSKAAKAPGHGEWFEAAALYWAEQRGKLIKAEEQGSNNLATV